jgi:hypothetical protein
LIIRNVFNPLSIAAGLYRIMFNLFGKNLHENMPSKNIPVFAGITLYYLYVDYSERSIFFYRQFKKCYP